MPSRVWHIGGGGSSHPTGAAGGDLAGTYPNPTVNKINISGTANAAAFVTGGTEIHAGDGPGFPATIILEGCDTPNATPGGIYYDNATDQFYVCKSDGWHQVTTL